MSEPEDPPSAYCVCKDFPRESRLKLFVVGLRMVAKRFSVNNCGCESINPSTSQYQLYVDSTTTPTISVPTQSVSGRLPCASERSPDPLDHSPARCCSNADQFRLNFFMALSFEIKGKSLPLGAKSSLPTLIPCR